ncbi:hypothetical protein KGY71_01365 [Candidatus Bipolaricaulota bacterium]|nr:hypothetical protein [Candidatus Bipolaricaulota bacterium]
MERIGKKLPEKYRGPWEKLGVQMSGLIKIQGVYYVLSSEEAEENRILQSVDEIDGGELIEKVPGGEDISHGKVEDYDLLEKIRKARKQGKEE